jgi:hypothetical protein
MTRLDATAGRMLVNAAAAAGHGEDGLIQHLALMLDLDEGLAAMTAHDRFHTVGNVVMFVALAPLLATDGVSPQGAMANLAARIRDTGTIPGHVDKGHYDDPEAAAAALVRAGALFDLHY